MAGRGDDNPFLPHHVGGRVPLHELGGAPLRELDLSGSHRGLHQVDPRLPCRRRGGPIGHRELVGTLGRIPGVLQVTRTHAGFSIEMEKGADVRAEVSKAVVARARPPLDGLLAERAGRGLHGRDKGVGRVNLNKVWALRALRGAQGRRSEEGARARSPDDPDRHHPVLPPSDERSTPVHLRREPLRVGAGHLRPPGLLPSLHRSADSGRLDVGGVRAGYGGGACCPSRSAGTSSWPGSSREATCSSRWSYS